MTPTHPVAGTWLEETLARALHEAFGDHDSEACLDGYDLEHARSLVATPAGQSLAARVAALEAAVDEELTTRDEYHDIADNLSLAIAPMDVIGEHSSGNDPWANAIEEAAELHARIAALEAAVPEDPYVWDIGGSWCFWCYTIEPAHKPACRWLAVRGGVTSTAR
jgi:hypothetical protein